MSDLQHLSVHVRAHIDGGQRIEQDVDVVVPPGYDAADVRALMRRTIEDAAFELNEREFGRAPTRAALIAAAARLRAIEHILDRLQPDTEAAALRLTLRAILALSNDDVTAQWGEHPE
jgi:hypothetical protein